MQQPEFEFAYEGRPVGYLQEANCPADEGHYRYVPYHGIGSFMLALAIRKGHHPRCTLLNHPDVSFVVRSCPQYGVIELCDFAATAAAR